jgi:hypothetical protein
MFNTNAVSLNGKLHEFKYVSGAGTDVTKGFCANCGSPIFGSNTRLPDHLTLTLGTMDDASALSVQVVIFNRDSQHWDQLTEDVTFFDTQPEWSPEL